jgi:hypothetical protein
MARQSNGGRGPGGRRPREGSSDRWPEEIVASPDRVDDRDLPGLDQGPKHRVSAPSDPLLGDPLRMDGHSRPRVSSVPMDHYGQVGPFGGSGAADNAHKVWRHARSCNVSAISLLQ